MARGHEKQRQRSRVERKSVAGASGPMRLGAAFRHELPAAWQSPWMAGSAVIEHLHYYLWALVRSPALKRQADKVVPEMSSAGAGTDVWRYGIGQRRVWGLGRCGAGKTGRGSF